MFVSHPLRLLPAGPATGGAVVLRPDFAARRRAVVGSPAHLAVQADALFVRMMERRQARPAEPGAADAALRAVARGVEAASRRASRASRASVAFVDPSAGLAALSAQLAAVTHPGCAP